MYKIIIKQSHRVYEKTTLAYNYLLLKLRIYVTYKLYKTVAVRGDRSTTHFCLYNIYYYNNPSGRWPHYFQLGTYSLNPDT